jgi:hypothetical protein
VKHWIRPDGTGFIVKNRYPIEARHGYENYSEHTTYNLLACSMLAQAWQFAVLEPQGVMLKRSGERLKHCNGMVEAAIGEIPGKRVVYRISGASN